MQARASRQLPTLYSIISTRMRPWRMRVWTVLDKHEIEKDIENFVNQYGTGNQIHQPPSFVKILIVNLLGPPAPPTIKLVTDFTRVSTHPQVQVNGHGHTAYRRVNSVALHNAILPTKYCRLLPNNNSAGTSLYSVLFFCITNQSAIYATLPLAEVDHDSEVMSKRHLLPIPQQPSDNTIFFCRQLLFYYVPSFV